MYEFNIELFPASYGESILVSCKGESKTNILIDMGFRSTYNNSIKNKLEVLKNRNEIIDLLVFTHFDADHISGGLQFLKENSNAVDTNIIKVNEIWFNSFRHLNINSNEIKLTYRDEFLLKTIISKGYPKELYESYINDISVNQAATLSSLVKKGGYKWNSSFNGGAVLTEKSEIFKEIFINNEVKIIILSPDENNLNGLIDLWKDELLEAGLNLSCQKMKKGHLQI